MLRLMTPDNENTGPKAAPTPRQPAPDSGAERRSVTAGHERLASVEAVLADGELSPPAKLQRLTNWDRQHGTAGSHGRVADAADLGFPDPAPYSPEVQAAIVALYRRHRQDLPPPEAGAWAAKGP